MSARFTAVLEDVVAAPEVGVNPPNMVQASSATLTADGLTVEHAPRRRPKPRRVIVWVHDLEGVRVGAIT